MAEINDLFYNYHLNPCAKCKGRGKLCYMTSTTRWGYDSYVQCDSCGAVTDLYPTAKEASDAWNSRQDEVSLMDSKERFEYELLKELRNELGLEPDADIAEEVIKGETLLAVLKYVKENKSLRRKV